MAPFSGDSRYYKAVIRKIHRQVIPFQAQVSFIGYASFWLFFIILIISIMDVYPEKWVYFCD